MYKSPLRSVASRILMHVDTGYPNHFDYCEHLSLVKDLGPGGFDLLSARVRSRWRSTGWTLDAFVNGISMALHAKLFGLVVWPAASRLGDSLTPKTKLS